MKIKFLLLTFLICGFSTAQTKGTIKGILKDKEANNAPLAFANAVIKGTSTGVTTDDKGQYSLSIAPGNYVIQFSFVGYENAEFPIIVESGKTVTLEAALGSGGYKLEDVVVKSVKKRNTETAIMLEIKEAKQVVSSISSEQMSKGTDGNAAQAIQRVPGITIVDGKFVMIRGLSERYNNVLVNGSIAPSTEIDKRTFSFDLVPRSEAESKVIKEIILFFKKESATQKGAASAGAAGLFLKSPSVFKLQYMSGGKSHPFLHQFKMCALNSMSVNYTGSGTYATYSDATPVHMHMALSFQELTPIYREDYSNLNKPITGTGF